MVLFLFSALTRGCFDWFLPRWGEYLDQPALGEELWRAPMREMMADLDYLAAPGRLTELWDHHTTLIEADHAPDAHALNTACRNDLLLIWHLDTPERRIDVRPALGWYDITSMPHRPRYDLGALAESLNQGGFHTRSGQGWTSLAVFKLTPRLIEVAPRLLSGAEWDTRKRQLSRVTWNS